MMSSRCGLSIRGNQLNPPLMTHKDQQRYPKYSNSTGSAPSLVLLKWIWWANESGKHMYGNYEKETYIHKMQSWEELSICLSGSRTMSNRQTKWSSRKHGRPYRYLLHFQNTYSLNHAHVLEVNNVWSALVEQMLRCDNILNQRWIEWTRTWEHASHVCANWGSVPVQMVQEATVVHINSSGNVESRFHIWIVTMPMHVTTY